MRPRLIGKVGRYTIANGLPALLNFGGMVALTHLLSPSEYGTYALVVASVAVVNAIGFQWLRSGARRFLAAGEHTRPLVLPTLGIAYAVIFTLVAGLIAIGVSMFRSHATIDFLLIGGCLLLAQAWYELNIEIVLAEINPRRYGFAALTRSVTAVCLSLTLAYAGWGAVGALTGAIVGFSLPGVALSWIYWRGLGRLVPSKQLARSLVDYGAPLTASYALQFVMDSADRLLLGWLATTAAVGIYAVAYDLAQQTLNFLMVAINLAAFPMAVRALENEGVDAARAELRTQVVLLALLALPGAIGLSLLAPQIGATLLGQSFSAASAGLVPVIVVGAICCGFKAFYFDLAFQLAKQTRPLIWIGLVGATLNTVLNLLWIPTRGPAGAALASSVTFVIVMLGSMGLGRRFFALPLPWRELGKVGLLTLVMGVCVRAASLALSGSLALWVPMVIGLGVVVLGSILLNVVEARVWLLARPPNSHPGQQ